MNYEELNAALKEKMEAEQAQFKEKLLTLSPENILAHAYQFVTQEDIILAADSNYLSMEQMTALLELEKPLETVYQQFLSADVDTLEPLRSCMADRADIELQADEREWANAEPDMEPDAAEMPDKAAGRVAEPERPSILEQLRAGGNRAAPDHTAKQPAQER